MNIITFFNKPSVNTKFPFILILPVEAQRRLGMLPSEDQRVPEDPFWIKHSGHLNYFYGFDLSFKHWENLEEYFPWLYD